MLREDVICSVIIRTGKRHIKHIFTFKAKKIELGEAFM
jgi:hypothetical protein